MSPVAISGVDKQGVDVNGVQVKQALSDANETVNKGVYDPTTLSTVDADLATPNIKSGITIFGKAGSATVLDVSDADAAIAEVLNPKTFYSVTGPRKTGTMPTAAITDANDNYPAGYHAGNVGGLDAIDLDLAAANIKSGVTIFGKAGAATVQDISAADAAVTDVKAPKTFFSVTGGIKTGTLATVALDPAANAYPAGYHVGAASLTAVDADLVTGSIKSGVTIFGVAGAATVQEIGAADALVTDVKAAKTFFSVTGGIKTGTLATVALDPAANAYPAGYHVGAASLTAVDADLVTGSIKSGVTIFGVAGAATVQDIADADLTVAEAPTGKKFYAVSGGVKTGTGTKTLSNANDTVAAGYYAATTLHAVDADLAVGNIKSGVTIFGFLGTYISPLSQDLVASAITADLSPSSGTYFKDVNVNAGADYDIATTTNIFAASSMAVAVGFLNTQAFGGNASIRLYMNGVLVTGEAIATGVSYLKILVGTRALSGSKICKIAVFNGAAGSEAFKLCGGSSAARPASGGIGVGNIKVTA